MPSDIERELMAEVATYPSNSKTSLEKKKLEPVVTNQVKRRKQSLGKKMAETFLVEDNQNVGDYVVYDVLIPAFKELIYDSFRGIFDGFKNGLEQALFGGRRSRNLRRDDGRSYTNYNKASYVNLRNHNKERDQSISRQNRARHNFDEIILETRGEAEEVLDQLVELTQKYEMVSVADLYILVDLVPEFTDDKYGWYDLSKASISRARGGGYILNLPRTQLLE